MTNPDIFAAGEDSTNSFLNSPSGQGDGPRLVVRTATVADSASVATVYGMIPFRKGAQFSYGATTVITTAIDTATLLTLDVGYVYKDNDTSSNINDPNAFVDGSTTGRAGGVIFFDQIAGKTFEATADGWLVITTADGSVTTAGTITASAMISYQS